MNRMGLTSLPLLVLLLSAFADVPAQRHEVVAAKDFAYIEPTRVCRGPGRFVFVPDSLTDQVDGCFLVEAEGLPGCLRTVSFAPDETDDGLDVARPIVVEGELVLIRHRASGEYPELVELQVRHARQVR